MRDTKMPWSAWEWKGSIWFFGLLFLEIQMAHTSCEFPTPLTQVYEWSSKVTGRGNIVGKLYFFEKHTMRVSENGQEHRFTCHQLITPESYLVREETEEDIKYKCVKFDQWSPNVVQIHESRTDPAPLEALCEEKNLVADPWPLIWKYLDNGYVPCPSIGGYNMDVLDQNGESICAYLNPLKQSRFESECIYGEGIQMEFSSGWCKGDMPLGRREKLLCLGHKSKGLENYMIVTNNHHWPKIYSFKYRKEGNGDKITMYFSQNISLNLTKSESRVTWHIELTRKSYATLCEDEYSNCRAPAMCRGASLLHCQATCRNYTTCLSDLADCSFENKYNGQWMEQSISGKRMIKVDNHTAYIDKLASFKCLSIFSSTHDGLKPVFKVLKNGCKPRFACLDMEYFSSSIAMYRLSQSISWPYKDNLVRGDICNEDMFRDDPYPFSFAYRSQHHRVLVKVPKSDSNSGRSSVSCNIPHGIRFTMSSQGQQCTGTLNSCQSGDVMVMTFNRACNKPQTRVFHRCLAQYRTRTQRYIFTEKYDNINELYCWVFKEDPLQVRNNVFLQLHTGDCTNGTTITLGGGNEGIPYINAFSYNSDSRDRNADSCIDMSLLQRRPPPIATSTILPTSETTTATATSNRTDRSQPAQQLNITSTEKSTIASTLKSSTIQPELTTTSGTDGKTTIVPPLAETITKTTIPEDGVKSFTATPSSNPSTDMSSTDEPTTKTTTPITTTAGTTATTVPSTLKSVAVSTVSDGTTTTSTIPSILVSSSESSTITTTKVSTTKDTTSMSTFQRSEAMKTQPTTNLPSNTTIVTSQHSKLKTMTTLETTLEESAPPTPTTIAKETVPPQISTSLTDEISSTKSPTNPTSSKSTSITTTKRTTSAEAGTIPSEEAKTSAMPTSVATSTEASATPTLAATHTEITVTEAEKRSPSTLTAQFVTDIPQDGTKQTLTSGNSSRNVTTVTPKPEKEKETKKPDKDVNRVKKDSQNENTILPQPVVSSAGKRIYPNSPLGLTLTVILCLLASRC